MSSASSSFIRLPRDSAGRNNMPGGQNVELRERKRKPAGIKDPNHLNNGHHFSLSSRGLSPSEAPSRYARGLRQNSVGPSTWMKGEDQLRSQEAIVAMQPIFEEVAVEQDEWARVLEIHSRDGVPDSNLTGSKP